MNNSIDFTLSLVKCIPNKDLYLYKQKKSHLIIKKDTSSRIQEKKITSLANLFENLQVKESKDPARLEEKIKVNLANLCNIEKVNLIHNSVESFSIGQNDAMLIEN